MPLADTIKTLRALKGVKQATIAKALGTERTNYHRIENRGNKMTLEQLEKIAQALDVTLIELLTYGEEVIYADSSERMAKLESQLHSLQEENRYLVDLLSIAKGRDELRREMAKKSYQSMQGLSKKAKGLENPEIKMLMYFVDFIMKLLVADEEDEGEGPD